ncbi:uncharacterized protein PAE49_019743 isoform 2-T5 [Odontesthes bonariensis]|uniref:uncharacterized protein LOC142367527 isoform X2 n=1 Tax=Odontesthes bonariensis TaxID=219752 RepID=UPI003F588CCD
MQPESSGKSQLFDSLKVYLNNQNRLQPIIGLDSIIECVNVGTRNKETLFLCEVCVCRLNKADMRNHILGSLHRFSYIKACHPHLVSKWQENSDLSKLAWPLMEMAKMLEAKEGPGDIQFLEVADTLYQMVATQTEKQVTLIHDLRYERAESESFSEALHFPIKSKRVVLFPQNQQRHPEKSPEADTDSYEISAHGNRFPPLVSEHVARFAESKVYLRSRATSHFLDDYSEARPLIGLVRVVEFRSEDGCSHGFLCHCCRMRSNKKDIIDHLTSSSHISNYLMETQPDELQVIREDLNDNCQLLQSLAEKVEKDEGRGDQKVVQVPESHCRQLTGKSYHWCLKMLSSGWTHNNTQKKIKAVKGPCGNNTSVQRGSEKCTLGTPKQAQRVKPKKKKKKTNTVFNVSLLLPKGKMLLKRRSFSVDTRLEPAAPPSFDFDPVSLPEAEMVDCEVECDPAPFALNHDEDTFESQTSEPQLNFYQEDGEFGDSIPQGHIPSTASQDVDGYNVFLNQSQDKNGTEDHTVYGEWKYDRGHGSHERSSHEFRKNWENEDIKTESKEQFPAVFHTQHCPPYNPYYIPQEGGYEHWHSSVPDNRVGTGYSSQERNNKDMNSNAVQQYPQQQYQNQQMAWVDPSLQPGRMWWHHDVSGEVVPYLDAARVTMQTPAGDTRVHSGSISSEHTVQLHKTDVRQLQRCTQFTVNHFQRPPQNYMTQPSTYQAGQAYHSLPWTNPEQHFAFPAGGAGAGLDMMQTNGSIQPGQPVCHGAYSDVYFRAGAPL